MSNKSYTDEIKDGILSKWKMIQDFADEHDFQSMPAFLIFFAVITVGMIFNVEAFQSVVGRFASVSIAVFFEVSILAWKSVTSRKRNDAKQNQLSYWALWLSVILAISMLTVNLFRIGGEKTFEYIAYAIVGIAATVQVVFYLLFDQANPDKKMIRQFSQEDRDILRGNQEADGVILRTESRMKIVRKIATELRRLQNEFSDLPQVQLEYLLENARKELLSQYARGDQSIDKETNGLADVNGDGVIGKATSSQIPPITTHDQIERDRGF